MKRIGQFFPSIEHVELHAVGGIDTLDNWITTSMARNHVRSRYSLGQLGWRVKPREPDPNWDGGVSLFSDLMLKNEGLRSDSKWGKYLVRWERIVNELATTQRLRLQRRDL